MCSRTYKLNRENAACRRHAALRAFFVFLRLHEDGRSYTRTGLNSVKCLLSPNIIPVTSFSFINCFFPINDEQGAQFDTVEVLIRVARAPGQYREGSREHFEHFDEKS